MHVVLVSGWGKLDFMWKPYRKYFASRGLTTSVLNTSYANFGPIQAGSKQLARHVNDLKHPPFLVGHSLGGLIIRHYVAQHLPASHTKIAGVATIATPHEGTPLAKIAPFSASACQAKPDSGFLRKFEAFQEPDIPWMSVRCSYDLVVPGNGTLLDVMDGMHVEVPHTHMSVLLSRTVADLISDFAMTVATRDVILGEDVEVEDDD